MLPLGIQPLLQLHLLQCYLKYAAQAVFYTNPSGNVLHMRFVGTWVRKRSYISKTGKRFNDSLLKY